MLVEWRNAGIKTYIYSSGSREAQRLFFGHSQAGDLRPFLSGFFDTTSGPKTETASYTNIQHTLGVDDADQVCSSMSAACSASAGHQQLHLLALAVCLVTVQLDHQACCDKHRNMQQMLMCFASCRCCLQLMCLLRRRLLLLLVGGLCWCHGQATSHCQRSRASVSLSLCSSCCLCECGGLFRPSSLPGMPQGRSRSNGNHPSVRAPTPCQV